MNQLRMVSLGSQLRARGNLGLNLGLARLD
jgi:hypothetical protein